MSALIFAVVVLLQLWKFSSTVGIGWDSQEEFDFAQAISRIQDTVDLRDAYDLAPVASEHLNGTFPTRFVQWVMMGLAALGIENDLPGPDMQSWYLPVYAWSARIGLLEFVAASASMGVAVYVLTGRWNASLLTFASIVGFPVLAGMSIVNFKDMPVAIGLSMIAAAQLIFLREPNGPRIALAMALGASGLLLSWLTRPGSLLIVVTQMLVGCVLVGTFAEYSTRKRWVTVWVWLGFSTLAAYLVAYQISPFLRIAPVAWVLDSINTSRIKTSPVNGFQQIEQTVTRVPYVVSEFVATWPVLWILLMALALLLLAKHSRRWSGNRCEIGAMLILSISGFLTPVALLIAGVRPGDNFRVVAFAYIPLITLVILVLLGRQEFSWMKSEPLRTSLIAAVSVTSSIVTLVWMPYSYSYSRPFAKLTDLSEKPALADYWGVTAREHLEQFRMQGITEVGVLPVVNSAIVFGGKSLDKISTESETYGLIIFEGNISEATRDRCELFNEIRRETRVLSSAYLCDRSSSPSTSGRRG